MVIVWNDRSIRWFRNASEYTGYSKKLAQILLEYIPSRNTLCDMGCGAAQIDFELANYIAQICCIDISQTVIDAVEQQARRQNVTNLTARCMDASGAVGEWETVLALFHGGSDVVSRYLPLAKDQLILATHGSLRGGFGPENRRVTKCFDVNGVQADLDKLGIRYRLREVKLEYGQPFTNRQDAEKFVKAYSKPMEPRELDAYLDENLEQTGDPGFPYYLPKIKEMGLFVIRRDENENF